MDFFGRDQRVLLSVRAERRHKFFDESAKSAVHRECGKLLHYRRMATMLGEVSKKIAERIRSAVARLGDKVGSAEMGDAPERPPGSFQTRLVNPGVVEFSGESLDFFVFTIHFAHHMDGLVQACADRSVLINRPD